MAYSLAEQKALAIMPKISSPLSMMGSAFMATDVLRDRKKRQQSYSRLVLGASCMDLASSFSFFLSTWPIPKSSGIYGASGTTGTCSFQGFFLQMGAIGLAGYLFCLMLYYLLVITFHWSDNRVKQLENWMHTGVLLVSISMAVAGLPLTLYNNAILWCWISSLPFQCANSRSGTGNCVRGDNAWIYRWAFFYGPLWFIIFFVIVSMTTVSYSVWAGEKASRKYRSYRASSDRQASASSFQSSNRSVRQASRDNKLTNLARQTALQGLLYVIAFFLVSLPSTIVRSLQTLERDVPFVVLLLVTIFAPLRGFLNYIVYIRPRFVRLRNMDTKASFLTIWIRAMRMTLPWIPNKVEPLKVFFRRDDTTPTEETSESDNGEEEYGAEEDAELLNPAQTLQEKRALTEIEEMPP